VLHLARCTLGREQAHRACGGAARGRPTPPNPYEASRCQETDSPEGRMCQFFPPGFRLSVLCLWQRVLSSFPLAGAPLWLPHTLLEGLPP
jgi:hypothetical protein